jgi:hypothetical protein
LGDRNWGVWIGAIAGIAIWQIALRPRVVDAIDYTGGLNIPLLALAAITAGLGAAVGAALWSLSSGRSHG